MIELEQEIFNPSGISTVDSPKMILNGVLVSKPCGILYHIDESTGIRYVAPREYHYSVTDKMQAHGATAVTPLPVRHSHDIVTFVSKTKITDAGWSSVIYLVMLFLLSRQITASRTPAGISRLSRWTFVTQALIDSIAFAIVGVIGHH